MTDAQSLLATFQNHHGTANLMDPRWHADCLATVLLAMAEQRITWTADDLRAAAAELQQLPGGALLP